MALLHEKGGRVRYHDPYVPTLPAREWRGDRDLASVALTPAELSAADCVVIVTDHRAFDRDVITKAAKLIVDSRNAIKGTHPHVFKLGAP